MKKFKTIERVFIILAAMACLLGAPGTQFANAQWTQWGGPNRNFMVDSKGLANQWPQDGPKKLWSRELGDGYSTVVVDGDRLYTQYRIGEDELVISMDAQTGKTVWEHKYPAPFTEEMKEYGPGPHATPLVLGDNLYAVGANMLFFCFDKKTGDIRWKHDLVAEHGLEPRPRGYSSSPIAWKDTVIIPGGAPEGKEGFSVLAFKQEDGGLVWKNQSFEVTHASPILIKVDGKDQLVVFMAAEIAGLNPDDGALIWSHPHKTQYGANMMTPMWTGDEYLFLSAAYDSGSRVIRLVSRDGKTVPEELWYSRKVRMHHANPVRVGDYVYGSSGDFGPAFFFGVNIKTGEVAWRQRGFAKATCILADGKVILLDEDGKLALATVSPEGMKILSEAQVLERTAWAAPTLAGKTLYIRDRKQIMALDLG